MDTESCILTCFKELAAKENKKQDEPVQECSSVVEHLSRIQWVPRPALHRTERREGRAEERRGQKRRRRRGREGAGRGGKKLYTTGRTWSRRAGFRIRGTLTCLHTEEHYAIERGNVRDRRIWAVSREYRHGVGQR